MGTHKKRLEKEKAEKEAEEKRRQERLAKKKAEEEKKQQVPQTDKVVELTDEEAAKLEKELAEEVSYHKKKMLAYTYTY